MEIVSSSVGERRIRKKKHEKALFVMFLSFEKEKKKETDSIIFDIYIIFFDLCVETTPLIVMMAENQLCFA